VPSLKISFLFPDADWKYAIEYGYVDAAGSVMLKNGILIGNPASIEPAAMTFPAFDTLNFDTESTFKFTSIADAPDAVFVTSKRIAAGEPEVFQITDPSISDVVEEPDIASVSVKFPSAVTLQYAVIRLVELPMVGPVSISSKISDPEIRTVVNEPVEGVADPIGMSSIPASSVSNRAAWFVSEVRMSARAVAGTAVPAGT